MTTITAKRASFSATPAWPTNCGPMTDSREFTEDAFLGGRLRLRQPKSGHRAGHDAMLLAAATPAHSGDRVVDLGAGVGAAGLAVARRVAGIELVLVEIDEVLAELGRGFGSLELLPVHAEARVPAIRVLIRAIKGGRAPLQMHAALLLNDESALPNKQVQDVLAGKGGLPLATP